MYSQITLVLIVNSRSLRVLLSDELKLCETKSTNLWKLSLLLVQSPAHSNRAPIDYKSYLYIPLHLSVVSLSVYSLFFDRLLSFPPPFDPPRISPVSQLVHALSRVDLRSCLPNLITPGFNTMLWSVTLFSPFSNNSQTATDSQNFIHCV